MSTTLRIERAFPMAVSIGDRKRSWPILLDGKRIGQIALNEVFETPIEPGTHTLRLTSTGSHRSPERTFTAADESVTAFTCHTQPYWPLLLMALVVPGRWIALKQH
jgi:hypothetical protein